MKLLLRLALGLSHFFSAAAAAQALDLPDGTLLFLENCNSVVQYATHGEVAHVALIFQDVGDTWVYEATPDKVRRVKIDDYFAELSRLNKNRDADERIRALALSPQPLYTADEVTRMRAYLEQQLGRRYSVKNYVRGKPYDGIHCAELASTTLNQSGRYAIADCHKIHPQALYTAALSTHASPRELTIPTLVAREPWLLRLQRRWIASLAWCRWSTREAWLFFW
jgi:hypothetical protein